MWGHQHGPLWRGWTWKVRTGDVAAGDECAQHRRAFFMLASLLACTVPWSVYEARLPHFLEAAVQTELT